MLLTLLRQQQEQNVEKEFVKELLLLHTYRETGKIFLRVDLNKQELFSFLSRTLAESVKHQKELVVTEGMQVLCVPAQQDAHLLAPCSHEEADSRMMLHVQHAAQHVHHQILVRTVDTDVVVLAVMVAETLSAEVEIWLAFGTGKNFRYLAAHKIAASLGSEKSLALPMFHALTGCDTVSAFVGHGKKTAWAVWSSFPDLTSALLELAHAPNENNVCISSRGLSYLFMTEQVLALT